MAVDGFDDSVEFALRNLQKETLELTVHQEEAMKSILIGKDTLVCLPTGHCKSIIFECLLHCYDYLHGALLPLGQPSSVIVISPLISLMVRQVDDLHKRNQSTVRLTHDLSKDECKLLNGSIRYIFLAPEALNERKWKSLLMTPIFNKSVEAVVCDEAHCVELWGSSIEPYHQSYSNLASLQAFLTSSIPYVALTATASISTKVKTCVK